MFRISRLHAKLNPHTEMKALFKITVQIVLVGALLGMAGCGKTPQPDSKAKLHVVVVAPLTGPGASLGEFIRNGIEIGRTDMMHQYGEKLELSIEYVDSKNQPKDGVSAYKAASLRVKPSAVISAMSSVSKALQPVAEADGTFMIATTTALSGLPQGTKNIIRIYPTSEDFVALTADHMASRSSKIAVFYVNDDFGKSNLAELAKRLSAHSKQISVQESFELTATDHRNSIQRALAKEPDAIFVTGYGPAYVGMIQQIREAAPSIPIYTEMSIANPAILKALGSAAEGIIFAGTDLELTEPATEAARAFKAAYESRFGTDTFMVAGFARDSLELIVHSAFDGKAFVGPNKARAIALSPISGCIGSIRMDDEGESHIPLKMMQRKGNRTIPLAAAP